MEKKLIILLTFLSAALLFAGCTKEDAAEGNTAETVSMNLSVSTRSAADPNVIGSEDKIYKLYVFIFSADGTQLENGSDVLITSDGTRTMLQRAWRVSRTAKKVCVVVNPNDGTEAQLGAVTNYTQLLAATADEVYNPMADYGMLMYGEKAVAVADIENEQAIPVVRRSCRIRLTIAKEGDWGTSTLFIKSVKLSARKDKTGVINDQLSRTDITTSVQDKRYIATPEGKEFGTTATEAGLFYTYAMPAKTNDADYLTIEALINGTPQTFTAYIAHDNQFDMPIDYQANKSINIDATVVASASVMKTKIFIEEWTPETVNGQVGKYVKVETAYWCRDNGDPIITQPLQTTIIDVGENRRKFQITCTANIDDWYVVITGDDNNPDIEARKITPIATSAKMPMGTQSITMDIPKLIGYEPYTHINISIYQDDIYPPSEGKPVKQWRYTQYAGFIPAWYIETLSPNPWAGTTFTDGVFVARNGNLVQTATTTSAEPFVGFEYVDCTLLGSGWYLPSVDQLRTVWNRRLPTNYFGNSYGSYIGSADYWTSTPVDGDNQYVINYTSPPFPLLYQLDIYFSEAHYRCIRNDKP